MNTLKFFQHLTPGTTHASFPVFLSLCLMAFSASAQKWELGLGLGATGYQGDIISQPSVSTWRPAGMLFVRNNLSPAVALRANVLFGGIRANAENSTNRYFADQNVTRNNTALADELALGFSTYVGELMVAGEYNFFDYRAEEYRPWSPYFFVGIGAMLFAPEAAPEPGNPSANAVQPVIPFGIGAKLILARNWNLGVEIGSRKTFTDYLDNTSTRLPNSAALTYPNRQRGLGTDDWYYFVGLTVSYTIYTIDCPYPGATYKTPGN